MQVSIEAAQLTVRGFRAGGLSPHPVADPERFAPVDSSAAHRKLDNRRTHGKPIIGIAY